MRVDKNPGSLPDVSSDDPPAGPELGAQSPAGEDWGADKLEQWDGGGQEYFQDRGFDHDPGHGGAPETIRLGDLQARSLFEGASRLSFAQRDQLSFLCRTPDELSGLKTLADLKQVADKLGFGGMLERAFEKATGASLNDVLAAFERQRNPGPDAEAMRALLPILTQSRNLGEAVGTAHQVARQLGQLAELANRAGLPDVGHQFSSLSRGAQQLAEWASQAQQLPGLSPQKFAGELGKYMGGLDDLKRLADHFGLGGLMNKAVGGDIAQHLGTLSKLAGQLPEAGQRLQQFLGQLQNLGHDIDVGSLSRQLQDLPGTLGSLAQHARGLGLSDLAGGIESTLGRVGQLSDLAGELRNLNPREAAERFANKLKDVSPADVRDLVMNQLPGKVSASGSFHAEGAALSHEVSYGSKDGPAYFRHKVEVLAAEASGSGSIEANLKEGKLHAQGQIDAEIALIRAEAEGHLRYGDFSAQGTAQAMVGARAHGEGELDVDLKNGKFFAQGQASAFVGARAGAEGAIEYGGVGAKGHVGARAGLGIEIGGSAGYDDGKLTLGFNFGAAFGIGVDFGFEFTVDFDEIGDKLEEWGSEIIHAFPGVVDDVFEAATDVGGAIVEGASAVGGAIAESAEAVGGAIADAGEAIGDAVGDLFSW